MIFLLILFIAFFVIMSIFWSGYAINRLNYRYDKNGIDLELEEDIKAMNSSLKNKNK